MFDDTVLRQDNHVQYAKNVRSIIRWECAFVSHHIHFKSDKLLSGRKNYETDMFSTGGNETELMTIYVDLLYRTLEVKKSWNLKYINLFLQADRFKRYNADQLLCLIESYDKRVKFKPKPMSNQDPF